MQSETLTYALKNRRSIRTFSTEPLLKSEILEIAWAAQGITSDDSKRTAPSANGLHPLRVYISTGASSELPPSVWSYNDSTSDLSVTAKKDIRKYLADAAIGNQDWIANSPCIMTLTANIDSMNYEFAAQPPLGKRGERYAYIEAGCAAQNAMLQATALGIGCTLVAGFDDIETCRILGVDLSIRPLLHLCFGHIDCTA